MSSELSTFNASGLTARLFQKIEQMSEQQKKELLILVGDQRKYQRKPFLMSVCYETENNVHKDFILDISPGGTFIETNKDFFIGQELTLKFNFKNRKDPFEIAGAIVWQSTNGVGIKFTFKTHNQKKELKEIVNEL